jgi:hypothetical protein
MPGNISFAHQQHFAIEDLVEHFLGMPVIFHTALYQRFVIVQIIAAYRHQSLGKRKKWWKGCVVPEKYYNFRVFLHLWTEKACFSFGNKIVPDYD